MRVCVRVFVRVCVLVCVRVFVRVCLLVCVLVCVLVYDDMLYTRVKVGTVPPIERIKRGGRREDGDGGRGRWKRGQIGRKGKRKINN